MKRDWSGCERRRRLRPPSQTPTPARRSQVSVCAACGSALRGLPRTRPFRVAARVTIRRHAPGFRGRCRQETRGPDIGAIIILRQAAGNRRPLIPPPCPWRLGRAVYSEECWRAARGGVTSGRPLAGQGGSSHHFDANRPLRLAAIRLPARGARPSSCGLRLRAERRRWHGGAWRTSPRYCGRSPRCRASCRRQHRGCR